MNENDRELTQWFESLIDGTIDDASYRALADRLDADEALRRAFVDHVQLHAALNWEHAEPLTEPTAADAEPAEAIVARIQPAASRRVWPRAVAIAAAVVVAGVAAAIVVSVLTPPVLQRPTQPPVALLLGDADVEWTSEPQRVGEPVSPQTLAIASGVLDLQFNSGAAIAVRGPGELTLLSANRCRLGRGVVTVHAPDGAEGFTVETAGFEVIDLGTGFGVRRDGASADEVHVFEGSVELRLADGTRRVMKAGEAAVIDATGVVRDVPINVFAFPPRADEPAPRWVDFADRLTLDPSLLLHTVVKAEDEAAAVTDRSKRKTTMRLLGGKPAAGRFGGDAAIQLGGPDDAVAFNLPGEHRAITMAMWVRLDRLPAGIASLIQTDGYATGQPHWNFNADGSMTLGVSGGAMLTASDAIAVGDLGHWTHLAATYDADAARIALYVNGRPLVEHAITKPLAVHFGPSRIGNWDRDPRPLGGAADNAMVFSRALNGDEVRQLYEAGAP